MTNREKRVHLAHCFQGENLRTCKYGDKYCPTKKKIISLTVIIKDKLKETFDWYVPSDHIPSNKKLYYEAIRIRKAIEKEIRNEIS